MEMSRKQNEALALLGEKGVNFILYGGAIRGAKTIWLALVFAILAIYYPRSRWVLMRADGPKLRNNLLPSVNYIYSKPDIACHIAKTNMSDLSWTFKNGSMVMLFAESYASDKELSRFHGLEVNGFGFDELPEFNIKTFQKAFERAGAWLNAGKGKNGKYPRPLVLASANPTQNWVKDDIYDPWRDGRLAKLKPNWRYIQARVYDNPYVKPSYLKSLKENMTPENYSRFVDGDWDYVIRTGHEWIKKFDFTTHVQETEYLNKEATYLSFDFNVWPYMTLLAFQIEEVRDLYTLQPRYKIRFYDEFCLAFPDNSGEAVVKAWIKKYPKVWGRRPVTYCGDASGENKVPGFGTKSAFNEVREALKGYTHEGSNQVFKKRFHNEFARAFLNDIMSGDLDVDVFIDPKCKNLIKDMQQCLEDPKGGFVKVIDVDPVTGTKFEKVGHCMDAFKYAMLSVFSNLYLTKYHRKSDLDRELDAVAKNDKAA